jgi:adenylate kinase family enzyme
MTKQDILKCIALLEKQKAENLSKQVSDDAEIQDDKQEQLRKRYDRIYTKNHPKYQLYQDAIFKFYDILEEQAKKLLNEALSLHEVMLG